MNMAAIKNVSMTDFGTEQSAIERQRKLAELLQQQSMTPDQGQTVSGWYVAPTKAQGVAKIAQALAAAYRGSQLDQQQSDLNSRQNKALSEGLQSYQQTLQGTPAQQRQIVDDEYGPQTINEPAVPGDRRAALAKLLESNHPMLQQMGAQMMMKEPEKVNAFGKIDPKDYTQESIGKFAASQNFADLVPVRKREFVNGMAVDAFNTPIGTVVPKESNPYADLVVPGPGGQIMPNTPLINAKKDIAKSGKTDVNLAVNTEKSFLNQVGEGVGKNIIDAQQKAQGAANTINTVNQIRDAIGSGKVIVGPGADARVFLEQVGQQIGVAGKDATERLTNTRQAIQGLAQLELEGAQQMKGQGQITEGERDIVRRAASGEIGKLTVPEMNVLLNTLDKTARNKIDQNKQNVDRLRTNKNAAPVVDFLSVNAPPAYAPSKVSPSVPATPSGNGWSITPIR